MISHSQTFSISLSNPFPTSTFFTWLTIFPCHPLFYPRYHLQLHPFLVLDHLFNFLTINITTSIPCITYFTYFHFGHSLNFFYLFLLIFFLSWILLDFDNCICISIEFFLLFSLINHTRSLPSLESIKAMHIRGKVLLQSRDKAT